MAASTEYSGMLQSLQLLVVRGVVDSDTAFLSNVRALPTPSDCADSFGDKGNLQFPPAILVHHIQSDVTTNLGDLAPKFHPSFNSVAAAALLGVSRPLLSALRGADMERPGKLQASIMTTDRLEATPGFRVGTSDHLETFGSHGLPGYSHLQGLALNEDTGMNLWYDCVYPQFGGNEIKMAPEGRSITEALSCCLTGFVPAGHFGPIGNAPPVLNGWDSWNLTNLTTHRMTWTLPISTEKMQISHPHLILIDFFRMKGNDLTFTLAVWDEVFSMVTHPLAASILDGISAAFSPTVKDLVRWGSMNHPEGADKKALYQRVWRSKSLADKDRFFSRGRPLPIDEGLDQINMNSVASSD